MTTEKITRREWLIAAAIALAATLLLQAPYALGYWTARAETVYTGLLVNLSDVTYYVAMQLGQQGEWLYRIRFTTEPHNGAFLYTFYLALGHLARLLGMNVESMWHLSRAGAAFGMFMVVFGFGAFFIENPYWRRVALLLALFGAGWDFFRWPWEAFDAADALPLEWRMPEAHLFFSALAFPHYSAAIACLLIVFWSALRGLTETLARRKWLALGVCGALANVGLVLVYPFLIILSASVLGVFYLALTWRAKQILWRDALWLAALFLPALPLLLYYQWTLATNEIIRLWNEQVETYSPNPLHYVLTYGLYLAPALWNLWRARFGDAAHAPKRMFLWLWVGVVAVLLYAPLNAQRRFVEGVHVPLALLATIGWYETVLPRVRATRWFQKLARRPHYSADGLQKFGLVLFVTLAALASGFLWLSAVLQNTLQQPYPFFRPQAELAAMDWLRAHAGREDIVLATYYTGAWLPYRADTRTYVGQYYETTHFFEKYRAAQDFFDAATSDAARQKLWRESGATYLFYGPAERAAGTFDPETIQWLKRVYANDDAALYRFQD
ncbi:MAG: hypothetical protein DCC52_10850 [Chloroflexi bacterium]|nr:MAG: hypothetical protein DCC52_10850 [Chloroflexota bacterium]